MRDAKPGVGAQKDMMRTWSSDERAIVSARDSGKLIWLGRGSLVSLRQAGLTVLEAKLDGQDALRDKVYFVPAEQMQRARHVINPFLRFTARGKLV